MNNGCFQKSLLLKEEFARDVNYRHNFLKSLVKVIACKIRPKKKDIDTFSVNLGIDS